jgi:hypothetical protein
MKFKCSEHGTCWDRHLPRDPEEEVLHVALDPFPQLFVQAVTHSETSNTMLRQLHSRNEIARWFRIRKDRHGEPELYVYERFSQLCDPDRRGHSATSHIYPSFVSFIGDTSVGKSTLLRAMLLMGHVNSSGILNRDQEIPDDDRVDQLLRILDERRFGPVTRSGRTEHLKDPTTLGVCLYGDNSELEYQRSDDERSTTPRYPILFADCEGFGAGPSLTNAERMVSDASTSTITMSVETGTNRGRNARTLNCPDGQTRSLSTDQSTQNLLSKDPVIANCYRTVTKDGVDLFYARYLYAISDVVVFVTKEDQKLHIQLTRVLEWTSAAVYTSVNHPSKKTLIVVRNMSEHHDPHLYATENLEHLLLYDHEDLWKSSTVLTEFVNEYNKRAINFTDRITSNKRLFDVLFQHITCCYIPHERHVKGTTELFDQFVKLRSKIELASRSGQELRSTGFMQYNVPSLAGVLKKAFTHFRSTEKSFDFFVAARLDNPNPKSMSEHLANFLQHAYALRGRPPGEDARILLAVAMSLIIAAKRNYAPGKSRDFFSR